MSRIKVVVPISGGKDSQACAKLAAASYPPDQIRGLFCDTQYEHPDTYEHVDRIGELYGIRIDRVTAGSVEDQCYKHQRLPGGGARFCTEELKIWPTKRYLHALAIEQGSRIVSKKRGVSASDEGGFEVWYGMRSEESPDRDRRYAAKVCHELYEPHEVLGKYPQYLGKLGVRFRLAILDWSETLVKDWVGHAYLHPHYALGFDRVGCFPCEAAGDAPRAKAYQHDEFGQAQYRRVIRIAADLGKPVWNSKNGEAKYGSACALHCGT